MKFLIDECLHGSLVDLAHTAGYAADHVVWRGWGGQPDWHLMDEIIAGDYTFVTNNHVDFLRLYRRQPLHAGLVLLMEQVPPAHQRGIFLDALGFLRDRDLVNTALQIELEGDSVTYREYLWSASAARD